MLDWKDRLEELSVKCSTLVREMVLVLLVVVSVLMLALRCVDFVVWKSCR